MRGEMRLGRFEIGDLERDVVAAPIAIARRRLALVGGALSAWVFLAGIPG